MMVNAVTRSISDLVFAAISGSDLSAHFRRSGPSGTVLFKNADTSPWLMAQTVD